jgi:hypothetical protein
MIIMYFSRGHFVFLKEVTGNTICIFIVVLVGGHAYSLCLQVMCTASDPRSRVCWPLTVRGLYNLRETNFPSLRQYYKRPLLSLNIMESVYQIVDGYSMCMCHFIC